MADCRHRQFYEYNFADARRFTTAKNHQLLSLGDARQSVKLKLKHFFCNTFTACFLYNFSWNAINE